MGRQQNESRSLLFDPIKDRLISDGHSLAQCRFRRPPDKA